MSGTQLKRIDKESEYALKVHKDENFLENTMDDTTKAPLVPSANKWVCLAITCFVSSLDFALIFSFGALFVEMMDTFGTDRATSATVHSLLLGVSLSFAVVSGFLITLLGLPMMVLGSSILLPAGFILSFFVTDIHYLYVSIGIVSGIGVSIGHVSAVTVVRMVFMGNQKSLCITVHSTCVTIAGIVYPYILKWLAETFYLRGTFLVLGGAYLNNFAFFIITFLHKSTLSVSTQVAHKSRTNGDGVVSENTCICRNICHIFEICKKVLTKQIVCLLVAAGLTLATLNTFIQLVFDIADWKGFDESEAKQFFVMLTCSNILATVIPGLLKQRHGFNMYICLIITALCGCAGNLLILLSTSYALNSLGMCLIGLIAGGIMTSSIIIIFDQTSLEQVGLVTGLLFTVNGVLSATGGPLFGRIRDRSGSYAIVLISIASIQAVAAVIFTMAWVFETCIKRKSNQ